MHVIWEMGITSCAGYLGDQDHIGRMFDNLSYKLLTVIIVFDLTALMPFLKTLRDTTCQHTLKD